MHGRSPLAPLKKGGTRIKVPLFKGDLGGSRVSSNITKIHPYTTVLQSRNVFKVPLFKGDLGEFFEQSENRPHQNHPKPADL
jgi:hypothetical protein